MMSPIYAQYLSLLPYIRLQTFSEKGVQNYIASLPPATQQTIDALSTPMELNRPTLQFYSLVHNLSLNDHNSAERYKLLSNLLNIIDFRTALIFFLQACAQNGYNEVVNQLVATDFGQRLDAFMSVFVTETLAIKRTELS